MRLSKRIKRLFSGTSESTNFPIVGGVQYIHHLPARPNLGDHLCSPRHYFDLEADSDPSDVGPGLYVMGGGVFAEMGLRRLEELGVPPHRTIVWAVGQSIREGGDPQLLCEEQPFLDWSTRDRMSAPSEHRYVPCVSCHHSMLDAPIKGEETLVFLNADRQVTPRRGVEACREIASREGWKLLLNDCREDAFASALSRSQRLITNSYHGAYWGLLAGREVRLAGYSTKFHSLFASLGLPSDRVTRLEKGDVASLSEFVGGQAGSVDFDVLPDAGGTLQEARARNLAFAERLRNDGVIRDFRLNDQRSRAAER